MFINIRICLLCAVLLSYTVGSYSQDVLPSGSLSSLDDQFSATQQDMRGRDHGFKYMIDLQEARKALRNAPAYRSSMKENWTPMAFYLPGGEKVMLEVAEAPIADLGLYNLYPQNKTYKVKGRSYQGRISVTDKGIAGMIFKDGASFFIEHLENGQHVSYYPDPSSYDKFSCGAAELAGELKQRNNNTYRSNNSNGSTMRIFRIAIATTVEFYNARGGTNATVNADINDKLTALNALYEKEFAFTFELIQNNNNLLANAGLDPNNRTSSANNVIKNIVGESAYDIGHAFDDYSDELPPGYYSASGVAYIGRVCLSLKAGAWTGAAGNYSMDFFMGTFGHEVGHQFGADHSFYGTSNNCQNRSEGHGYEPGSGNSIMSYEGSCKANGSCATTHNITPYISTMYFHAHSIEQILNHVQNVSCYTTQSTGNSVPVVTVPSSYTIPKGTPFVLEGSATDGNGDAMVYNWEQYDTDNLSLSCPNGHPDDAAFSTSAPLFRSFDPSGSGNTRYFPRLTDILDNTQTLGEILPQVSRTTHFRLTARDFNPAGGGMACGETTVVVDGTSGPFVVNTGNTPTGFNAGQSTNITWNVANTNTAPVSCSTVDILFSFDGGQSFPTLLAQGVPNDGSHNVTIPNNGTEMGRIKIKASNNIFFDINDTDISIISTCNVLGGEVLPDNAVSANPGDPMLDLDLSAGQKITGFNSSLDAGDPSTKLAVENQNGSGTCISFSNSPRYEVIEFSVDVAGSYTFTESGDWFIMLNLYQGSYNPASTCTNWLNSSSYYNGTSVSISNKIVHNLQPGVTYLLVVSGFSSTDTYGSYSLTFTNGVGGSIYDTSNFPQTGFDYTYVMVNSFNQITDINASSDLSNDNIFTSDVYEVHGFSYLGGTNLSPYIGSSFTSLQAAVSSGNLCGNFSTNMVPVTVTGCTPGTETVTSSLDDGGTGTLRYVIDNGCAGDIIQFSQGLTGNTIILNSEITISEPLAIEGLGMHNISISGDGSFCIFSVTANSSLNLKNIALIDGYDLVNGGAFLNNGNVTMENVLFENNMQGQLPKAFTNNGTISIANGIVEIK